MMSPREISRLIYMAGLGVSLRLYANTDSWWVGGASLIIIIASISGIAEIEAKSLLLKVMEAVRTAK